MKLVQSLSSYASYLAIRNNAMKRYHASPEPVISFSDAISVQHLPKSESVSPLLFSLDSTLSQSRMYQKICVNDFTPTQLRQKYLFIRELEKGLSSSIFFFTYSHGTCIGNFHFIWKVLFMLNHVL
jgi:hypothetical protein